jgi:hypothetical protein
MLLLSRTQAKPVSSDSLYACIVSSPNFLPPPFFKHCTRRKQTKIVYSRGTQDPTKQIDTPEKDQKMRCFTDEDALVLGKWCADIETHYSKLHGHSTPMDIEWAKDGETGELFIVQARPETVRSRQAKGCLSQTHVNADHGETAIKGTAIGSDAAVGTVHVIKDLCEISSFKPGEILVADMTDPDWVSTPSSGWIFSALALGATYLVGTNLMPLSIVIMSSSFPPINTGPCHSYCLRRGYQPGWSDLPCGHCQSRAGCALHCGHQGLHRSAGDRQRIHH